MDTEARIVKKEWHLPVKLQIYSLELKAQAVRMAVKDGLGSALKYPQVDTVAPAA